jgi:hypothetical protein
VTAEMQIKLKRFTGLEVIMAAACLLSSSAGFFLGLIFDPEDKRNMFLRHVWLSLNCVAIHAEDCTIQNGKGFLFGCQVLCSHNGKRQNKQLCGDGNHTFNNTVNPLYNGPV